MPLIKSHHAPAALRSFSLADIERQAAQLLADAQRRAERLLSEAQREADQLKQQAQAQGMEQGRAEGRKQGMEQGRQHGHQAALTAATERMTQLAQSLQQVLGDYSEARLRLENEGIEDVVKLALAVAGRLARRAGAIEPQVLCDNLKDAMRLVAGGVELTIELHPAQLEAMQTQWPRMKLEFPAFEHVRWQSDESIAPGGCRLRSGRGQVDATLDTQLQRITTEVLGGQEAS